MSIRYLRDKKRYRFEFEANINGERIRATKMLPAAWNKKQADDFDKAECARLYAEETGIQGRRYFIADAVVVYLRERCINLKNGKGVGEEIHRCQSAFAGRYIDELPAVAREYAQFGAACTPPLAPATIRNRLAYLRAACRYAYKFHNMGDRDPAEKMQMPVVKNERHEYASREEMLKIARKMRPGAGRAVIRVAFYSGMRLGEILRARLIGNDCFLLEDTKNGDRRMVPVHPRVRCCLTHFPVAIKKRWIQRQFTEAAKDLNLGHLHVHDLRHSAASEMINSGASLYDVGTVLGHRSPQSTKRYAHLATDTLATAVGLIGRKAKTK